MLRTINATRYVTPLREGGSLPAIVEADDCGLYVLKFRGAGQGPLALVAELIAGEIGRALGLKVPEIVLMNVDASLGRNEPDYEIRELLRASTGLNLALDYLPGSIMFDAAARSRADAATASSAVWFDAFITNVDRTARNPNLLWWHKTLYLIDHGASLYFHHNWTDLEKMALTAFPAIREHVLLPGASELPETDASLRSKLNAEIFVEVLRAVPDEWLVPEPGVAGPAAKREAYVRYLSLRLSASPVFLEEAVRARTTLV
ncbi:MAG: HipA family kinase [Bryobacteraceae bacterium]